MFHYLDNAATTPVRPEAAQAALEAMTEGWGNPSSQYALGKQAADRMKLWRADLAGALGCGPEEVYFTSCGSESDNWAISGALECNRRAGKHIITTAIEHAAVLEPLKALERQGYEVTYLDVDRDGHISLDQLREAIRPDTILVSVMAVNNEVGSINPLKDIGQIVKDSQAFFHVDAVQGLGNIDLDVEEMGIDFMSTSAHKINGPKFLGFLYERDGIRLPNRIYGGDQELKRRAGTENVPGIAGFGQAVAEVQAESKADLQAKYTDFQKIILSRLDESGVAYEVNSPLTGLVSHHVLNLRLNGLSTYVLLANLDLAGFAVSGGSACTAGSLTPSHVLTAMFGQDSPKVSESIRISFGRYNTVEEVEAFAAALVKVARKLQDRKRED